MIIVGDIEDQNEGVWEENVAALEAFLAVSTQWRCLAHADGSVVRTGLDYTAVRDGFGLREIVMTPALWLDVQLIELGAIAASHDEVQA